ncbi:hypothetical protein QQS21_006507 [Conoideocrella luteorostrata]|uniref:Phytase A n=1 Tax=Conoideocrella luteorostrata TaxID=1105319 RepID=A0AAJ0FY65_9HYPO|nr:hypothetical protein QQS21_006507 [Conoideocrella luteorostrata]
MGILNDAVASLKALTAPGHKYRAIPAPVTDRDRVQQVFDERATRSRFFKLSMATMLLAVILFFSVAFGRNRADPKSCADSASCTYNPHKHWGQYSPYFSAPHGSIKPEVPSGCEVNFASVLSRHGSRYPTENKSKAYKKLIERIQKDVKNFGKGFEVIKQYKYTLGVNNLTSYGENELIKSGKTFFKRYQKLAEESTHPFVRSSGSDRVVLSAERFLHGFYKAKGKDGGKYLKDILVIPEGEGFNNTLDHGTCKNFEEGHDSDLGDVKKAAWRKIWATPIMERLNKKLPGAKLSLEETVYIMDLCPFSTVASDKGKSSDLCRMFSKEEWKGYEYYESLEKWYAYGPGNPLGPTQGVGYVNELIARLTKSPVVDQTSTNRTLDSQSTTFPINRLLYADFTHDNTLMTVYGALGLYMDATVLPTDHRVSPKKAGGFSASWTVPFGSRMYVEKMHCGKDAHELVRVLVDDRVVPPTGCKADKLGRCEINDFLKGLDFAKNGGHWDRC